MSLSVGRCIEWVFCERNSFNLFETMQMFCSWGKDVHVVWALSSNYLFFIFVNSFFSISDALSGYFSSNYERNSS